MKKLTLCLLFSLFSLVSFGQVVINPTTPYFENFETGTGGWVSSSGFPNEWQLGSVVAPPKSSITTNGPGGVRSWITDLGNNVAPSDGDGKYENNSLYYLNSPVYDFSAVTGTATIMFDHRRQLESGWDGVRMQYSTNGGVTWTLLGTTASGGTNWYNATTLSVNPGFICWTGTSTGWVTSSHALPAALNGLSDVRFRFVVYSDGSVTQDGFGFDNLFIFGGPVTNLAVTGLALPISSINKTATEAVSVNVQNVGTNTINSITFDINVTGPVAGTFTETVAVALPGLSATSVAVPLTGLMDMNLYGFYTIAITATVAADVNTANNTVTVIRENRRRVTAFPYSENFDGGTNTGWSLHPSFQLPGTQWVLANPPAKTFINSAASPTSAWITGTSGNYTPSTQTVLVSPIFDLSSFSASNQALISFDRILDIYGSDVFRVYYTLDQNATTGLNILDSPAWTGLNWYNLTNGFDGLAQSWRNSRELLSQVYGQSNVRFLFVMLSNSDANTGEGAGVDNIFIGSTGLPDLAVTQVISPTSGTNKLLPQTVTVRLENVGAGAISAATMKYKITGPTGVQTVSENVTFSTPIANATAQNYTFVQKANLSRIGDYYFEITADVTGDVNTANNALSFSSGGIAGTGHASALVAHLPVAGICRLDEDFTGTTGSTPPTDWAQEIIAGTATDTWRFNNPGGRDTPIGMSPPFAVFDSDNYSAGGGAENVALITPSVNLASSGAIRLGFKYWFLDGWLGKGFVELSTDGGTTWTTVANVGYGATGGVTLPYQTVDPTTADNAATADIDIDALAAGQADVKARFRWTGDWSYYWMIDNVTICASEAPDSLKATGSYTRVANTYVDQILVEWKDLSTTENGFVLQRATDIAGLGNWEIIANSTDIPANSTQYTDLAVFANTRYYYRLQYSYSAGLSSYSNVADAIIERVDNPLPAYKPVLTAKADYQKVQLSWNEPNVGHGIKHYEVYFGVENDGVPSNPNVRIAVTDDTKFTALGLVNGFKYSFIVKPVLGDGKYYENLSNIAYARPSVILDAEELSKQFNFNVYPNPNDGNFTLSLEGRQSEKLNVRIMNVAGQEVFGRKFGFFNGVLSETIDLTNVASGLYIIVAETDGGMIQKKISINK